LIASCTNNRIWIVSPDELLKLSEARREQLEDAIKLYSFFAECDDFDKWMNDKEKLLLADDQQDTVDTAKRKYEVGTPSQLIIYTVE
jgi:hypothetical protein